MANTEYPFNTHGVGSDTGTEHRLYTVSIAQGGYTTTDGNAAAGGVNPYSFKDFSTLPTNKNDGLNLARGGVRYQKVLQILGTHSNYRILKIQTDSSTDQDTPPTTLTFNILFENESAIPTSGTGADGSTTLSTREAVLKDLIADAIKASYTENVLYYDATHVEGTVDRGPVVEELTISAPGTDTEIFDSVTVTRVAEADSVGDDEKPSDDAA